MHDNTSPDPLNRSFFYLKNNNVYQKKEHSNKTRHASLQHSWACMRKTLMKEKKNKNICLVIPEQVNSLLKKKTKTETEKKPASLDLPNHSYWNYSHHPSNSSRLGDLPSMAVFMWCWMWRACLCWVPASSTVRWVCAVAGIIWLWRSVAWGPSMGAPRGLPGRRSG